MQWETETGKLFGVSPSLLGALRSFTPLQVLDEAHKVLTSSNAARLTRSIASIIRQQRHLATRVVIATQEPTVIPRTVLDLASFVMCHRSRRRNGVTASQDMSVLVRTSGLRT